MHVTENYGSVQELTRAHACQTNYSVQSDAKKPNSDRIREQHTSTSNINNIRTVNATQTTTNAEDDSFSLGVEEKSVLEKPSENIKCTVLQSLCM